MEGADLQFAQARHAGWPSFRGGRVKGMSGDEGMRVIKGVCFTSQTLHFMKRYRFQQAGDEGQCKNLLAGVMLWSHLCQFEPMRLM